LTLALDKMALGDMGAAGHGHGHGQTSAVHLRLALPHVRAALRQLRDSCGGRGLHPSTFQLNLSRLGHTPLCPPV